MIANYCLNIFHDISKLVFVTNCPVHIFVTQYAREGITIIVISENSADSCCIYTIEELYLLVLYQINSTKMLVMS